MADILSEAAEIAAQANRLKSMTLYAVALASGDLETLAAILKEAEQDTALDALIKQVNLAAWEEMQAELADQSGESKGI